MDIEQEHLTETAVSLLSVAIILAVFYAIGATYNSDGISSEGGLYLIGSIVFFIALMAAAGIYLAFTVSDPTVDETEDKELE
jgi:predicted Na+-dependent transporter